MTLEMLRYFVALADRRSFTEAAEVCFVSQSALSRAIGNLEQQTGCALLVRQSRKSVELTGAGQVLYVEAKRVLSQMRSLEERVRRAAEESLRTLTLGYIAYGMLTAFRQRMGSRLYDLREKGLAMETVYATAPELRERLMSGELDCAVLPETAIRDLGGLRHCVFHEAEGRIMIPKGHPLFGRARVRLSELADSAFVFYDARELPATFVRQVQACRENGFEPRIAAYGHKLGDIEALIEQHGAVSITTDVFDYADSDVIHVRPLDGYGKSPYVLAMREEERNPAAERFFALVSGACAGGC